MLMGAVGLLLSIGCANIADLYLARSIARQRDIAIRITLGADRRQVVLLLLSPRSFLPFLGD